MPEPIYLDNNATTQPDAAVLQAMMRAGGELWANPSSVHRAGQATRRQIDLAREQVAALIGCRDRELIFTSGATEADNLALRGIVAARDTPRSPRKTLITSTTEHSAIGEPANQLEREGYRVIRLGVSAAGLVDPTQLQKAIDEQAGDIALVSIHWANNETGVLQPIAQLGEICRAAGVPLHTDATQAVGKLPVDVSQTPIDALSFSAHKFHGPKGIGGLYLKGTQRLRPQNIGGPQERERRGGTENTPAIIGMAKAAELAIDWLHGEGPAQLAALRDRFEQATIDAVEGSVVNAAGVERLVNTTNIAFSPLEAEAILILLSERGVYAAAGAACSSGSLESSPVLLAMGLPEPVAHASVRFSLSRYTTADQIDQALQIIPPAVGRLRQSMTVG